MVGKSRKPIQRKARLQSSGPPERRTRVKSVNRKRKAANMKRAYGPVERREWVKRQACANCHTTRGIAYGTEVEIVSAHIVTGGMSRKSEADKTVPLCERKDGRGCHQIQHGLNGGWSALLRLDTPEKREAAAATTEAAWQAHQGAA